MLRGFCVCRAVQMTFENPEVFGAFGPEYNFGPKTQYVHVCWNFTSACIFVVSCSSLSKVRKRWIHLCRCKSAFLVQEIYFIFIVTIYLVTDSVIISHQVTTFNLQLSLGIEVESCLSRAQTSVKVVLLCRWAFSKGKLSWCYVCTDFKPNSVSTPLLACSSSNIFPRRKILNQIRIT